MTSIVPLRSVAIASNLLFILYRMLGDIYPVFFLHLALLPINLIKLHRTRYRPPQMATNDQSRERRPIPCLTIYHR
jgi:hypothetical protein